MRGGAGTTSPLAAVTVATVALAAAVGLASGLEPAAGVGIAIALAFVALVLADLLAGVAVVVLFAYLETYTALGSLSLAKATGALVVVAWLAAVAVGGRRPPSLIADRPGLVYLLLAFLGWVAISVTWSAVEPDAYDSAQRYALNMVLFPVVYAAVRTGRDVVRLLAVVVAGATFAAISGVLGGASASTDVTARASGSVGDANELAAGLVVGISLAAACALDRHVRGPLRLLAGAAAVVCLVGLLSTLSRGGLLGLFAALLCAVLVGGRWRGRMLAATATVVVGAVSWFAFIAPVTATERVLTVGGGTGRVDLWTVGERMVDAHPIAGVGAGQFAVSSPSYLLEPGTIERGDFILASPKVVHNTYLGVAAELGLVGAALFAAILVAAVGSLLLAIREARRAGDERLEILLRGLAAGLGGYLVAIVFISENYSKLLWTLLALGPAALAAMRAQARGRAR
jgi:putative inorganic carbon (HCO3(-)) transporter